MAAPTSYTEEELAQFMLERLGKVAEVLGWEAHDLTESVNDALIAYGVEDVMDASDVAKLRAIATYHAWQAAVAGLTTAIDFTRPEGSYSRSQMLRAARQNLQDAAVDAGQWLSGRPVAYLWKVNHSEDPYRPAEGSGEFAS